MSWIGYFSWMWTWIYDYFYIKKLNTYLGDADAILLVPYSDDSLIPHKGYYHKNLVGNSPGYATEDGAMYLAEGKGNPIKYFDGFPVVLALNPSHHAAVLEPIKSLIAHKRDEGEFVRVDSEGEVVEMGQAVAVADGGAVPTANDSPTNINWQVYEGLFDLTPPPIKDSETGDIVDQVDGWIVDQSKAAELVPSKTSTEELALMQQRERNAAMATGDILKYILMGAVGVSLLWILFLIILGIATRGVPGLA